MERKSCYDCKNWMLCVVRHQFWHLIMGGMGVGILYENTHSAIYETVATHCAEYVHKPE